MLSNSFHGRDLFAPVAAQLALARLPACEALDPQHCIDTAWPEELAKIVYIDAFGNAMTGIRAQTVDTSAKLILNGNTLSWARTFSDVPPLSGFWYENSNGLVEIAVNQGRADSVFNIRIGDAVLIER
jgi:S-adenosylmethionine hydrolase